MSLQTPYSALLDEGSYEIAMPASVVVGGVTYDFVQWENASTNPVRTISLIADMSIYANYVPRVCEAGCEVSCQTACLGACQTSCLTSCQTTCLTTCQIGCEVACLTGCEVSCQTGCEGGVCQTSCEATCQIGCELSCQDACEIACQGTCLLACETACLTTCEAACQGGTCQTACETATQVTPPPAPLLPRVRGILYPFIPGPFDAVDKRRAGQGTRT